MPKKEPKGVFVRIPTKPAPKPKSQQQQAPAPRLTETSDDSDCEDMAGLAEQSSDDEDADQGPPSAKAPECPACAARPDAADALPCDRCLMTRTLSEQEVQRLRDAFGEGLSRGVSLMRDPGSSPNARACRACEAEDPRSACPCCGCYLCDGCYGTNSGWCPGCRQKLSPEELALLDETVKDPTVSAPAFRRGFAKGAQRQGMVDLGGKVEVRQQQDKAGLTNVLSHLSRGEGVGSSSSQDPPVPPPVQKLATEIISKMKNKGKGANARSLVKGPKAKEIGDRGKQCIPSGSFGHKSQSAYKKTNLKKPPPTPPESDGEDTDGPSPMASDDSSDDESAKRRNAKLRALLKGQVESSSSESDDDDDDEFFLAISKKAREEIANTPVGTDDRLTKEKGKVKRLGKETRDAWDQKAAELMIKAALKEAAKSRRRLPNAERQKLRGERRAAAGQSKPKTRARRGAVPGACHELTHIPADPNCGACLRSKLQAAPKTAPEQGVTPPPTKPLQKVHVDLLGPTTKY